MYRGGGGVREAYLNESYCFCDIRNREKNHRINFRIFLSFLLTIDIDLNDVMRSTRKSRGDINAGK